MSNSEKEKVTLLKTPQELVHIKHRISLRQYKYWLLMIRAYRENYELKKMPNEHGFYQIPIKTIEERFGYELVRNELRDDLEAIRCEPIIYNVLNKNGEKTLRGAGFISEWELSLNGLIGFKLPGFLQKSIESMDLKESIFQKINWEIFNSFNGKYEAILYKLCRDYVGTRRTPVISIDDFRSYMGISESEYSAFKDLNKYVISSSIGKINASLLAEINIDPNPVFTRKLRKIVSVQFIIEPKKSQICDIGDHPSFRFCIVPVSLIQQSEYLSSKPDVEIEFSIQRANEYISSQDSKAKPVKNIGAIYRKAIVEGWGKELQAKKTLDSKKQIIDESKKLIESEILRDIRRDELVQDFLRFSFNKAKKSLTPDIQNEYVRAYTNEVEKVKEIKYDFEKSEFLDKVQKANFMIWIKSKITPAFDQDAFEAWRQAHIKTAS